MVKFERTGKYSLLLKLDEEGIRQTKDCLESALRGSNISLQIALSGRVIHRSWEQETQICSLIIICSETSEIVWEREQKALHIFLDAETLALGIERLNAALETGYFYLAEFCELKIQGRSELDSLYLEVVSF